MQQNNKDIATITRTNEILRKYDFHLKKNFGQNFLIDLNILNKIVERAGVSENTNVIEIGPGIGALTEQLAKRAHRVVAYEIDDTLIPILKDTLGGYSNVTIIHEDILKADIRTMIENEFNDGREVVVVANLPYYITTPILMKLIEADLPITRYCVMVQKEVAERLCGGPGTKEYNALTIVTSYYTVPKIAFVVPSTVFVPKPNVDSAILLLEKREKPPVELVEESFFFKVVRGSFIQRRKTIYNNLKQSLRDVITIEDIQKGLDEAGIEPSIRGEALTIDQFAKLSNALLKYKVITN